MNFKEKLSNVVDNNNSLLCVGLDVDKEKMPDFLFQTNKYPFFDFNKSIIDSTKDLVCAYKLNMAFYEILGQRGIELLEKTINYIPKEIIIILDGKRNDIGNTARKYAENLFETLNADGATVNPYLGVDGITPFLEYREKCSFILCRTSNPSAVDFQDMIIDNVPLYQHIATKIKKWNTYGNCGAIVGATYPEELKIIRGILGEEIPLLIPGIGKQGGDLAAAVNYGTNANGELAIINSSRGILYARNDEKFADAARKKAFSLRDAINKCR